MIYEELKREVWKSEWGSKEGRRKEINIQIEKRKTRTNRIGQCVQKWAWRWLWKWMERKQFAFASVQPCDHLKKKSTYTHRSLRDEVLDSTVVSEINQWVTPTKSPTIRPGHPVSFGLRTHWSDTHDVTLMLWLKAKSNQNYSQAEWNEPSGSLRKKSAHSIYHNISKILK